MAVKKYSYKKQSRALCSKYTSVYEMASTGQGRLYSDTVLVDEELMDMVDMLFERLNCRKYLISSGYRTSEHDKIVGGNGKGYHTKGQAVDACFYDKQNNPIPAQIVCCVAQDLGFGGIANISKNYRYVHLDTRKGIKYFGDETKSLNTVTDNFYEYFNITKNQVAKYTGEVVEVPQYYNKYNGTSNKLDTVLSQIGVPSDYIGNWKKRNPLALRNGINYYIGSSSQNLKLVSLAKQGALRRV
ncbi:MAG: hypothetical protein IJO62_03220 [Clostridia bacterium]|nr:hypothetical protein [Clostridia bacterium]